MKYVVDEKKIFIARDSVVEFFGNDFNFAGKTFIDIGSGSGLFSLSAAMLGCKRVVSIDIDPLSIAATRLLRQKFAYLIPNDVEWIIKEDSILNDELVENFAKSADILYSWGVLHHTGNVELAMRNAASLVSENGVAYIALYNQTEASQWWLDIKNIYNSSFMPVKVLMIIIYTMFLTFEDIRKGRGFNMYDKKRGMYKWTDVIDWLGGLPYEPINVAHTLEFWKPLGFEATKVVPTIYDQPVYPRRFLKKYFVYLKVVGLGCNEFLFTRRQ